MAQKICHKRDTVHCAIFRTHVSYLSDTQGLCKHVCRMEPKPRSVPDDTFGRCE
jgi:hypothetical protein